ncbi:CsbD family protein [Streptomyces sp. NBC_00316]|uniref:CsbD family protein n=1 Tax=Streptomyces sp. NBC_00316 TaxID=2975710 RepID=UPI002E2928AB|nr:CsbD family protein [Streptomyces sp. NBC_00316]
MTKGVAKSKQIKGKMKETLGKAIGDKSMQKHGLSEQLRGKAQEITHKTADRVRKRTGH